MNPKAIKLISYGQFEKGFLNDVARAVGQEYLLPVIHAERHIDLTEYYDPARRQYDGNKLLQKIDLKHGSVSCKTVGLFRIDLFIPVLTYIYGQAFLNGRTAIASLYRLKNERYGMKADDQLLLERFTKEVIHELGHTFGLKHCYIPACVMLSSTYAEDIDQKESRLCLKCRSELKASGLLNVPGS